MVLGTVQIGLPYGRRRERGILPEGDAYRLLDTAWDLGIRAFDTSEAYGLAAPRLAAWLAARRRHGATSLVTKVKPTPSVDVGARASAAVARFADCANVTILSHDYSDGAAWESIVAAAATVGAAVGLSVYTPQEVAAACRLSAVSRVQAPGNVFDARAVDARGVASIRLDLRSVLLQGVLLEAPDVAERRAEGAGRLTVAVRQAAAEVGADPTALLVRAALAFARSDDRVVLGVDSERDFLSVAAALEISERSAYDFSARARGLAGTPNESVLDPRRWR